LWEQYHDEHEQAKSAWPHRARNVVLTRRSSGEAEINAYYGTESSTSGEHLSQLRGAALLMTAADRGGTAPA
jgi:hypothetical protein